MNGPHLFIDTFTLFLLLYVRCLQNIPSIPLQDAPSDPARQPASSFQQDAKAPAAVQQIEENRLNQDWQQQLFQAQLVYGEHAALEMEMDRKILKQFQRLPGIKSSFLGLDTVVGREYEIDFEDYLGTEIEHERPTKPGVHEIMEKKLGL
eukprot:gb/GECG01000792.1/.p1 GENE.gb/GECG01000792.1/~~gb/GECG01000792.1/.p1  ORF type:complete len:150 (+),score=23.09 gb/GECG01000792.1/:1-450(+)